MKPCPEPVVGFHAQQEPTPGCWHWCWLRLRAEGHLAAAQAAVGTFGATSWGLLHSWQRGCDHPRAGGSQPSLCGAGVGSRSPVEPRDGGAGWGAGAGCPPGAAAGLGGTVQMGAAPASSTRVLLLASCCRLGGGRRSQHQNPPLSAAAESLPRLQSSHRAHPSESSPGSSFGCGANLVLSSGLLHLLQPWAAPRGCTKRWHGARSPPAPRQLPWQREW